MTGQNSISTNIDNHDLAVTRIREAINLLTVTAISTSSDSPAPPAPEVVSVALNGVTSLLKQAEDAMLAMEFRAGLRAA